MTRDEAVVRIKSALGDRLLNLTTTVRKTRLSRSGFTGHPGHGPTHCTTISKRGCRRHLASMRREKWKSSITGRWTASA